MVNHNRQRLLVDTDAYCKLGVAELLVDAVAVLGVAVDECGRLAALPFMLRRGRLRNPEFPISKCLGANKVPSSTRAIVVSHGCRQPSNQAHKTIRRRELAAVRQRRHLSLRLHSPPTPPGTHLPLGYLSSRLMTSRIFATLVLDGARLYAPTLAGIPPGTLPPQEAETPTSWHAAPDVHPS